MSERDKLIELIEQAEGQINNDMPSIEQIADHLLANGVTALDTSVISPKNRPLITHFAGMPINDVLDLVRAKQEDRLIVPPCKMGDKIFVIPSKANFELNVLHNMKQNNRVYEQVIDHITIWQDDYMLYTCDGLCAVRSKAYKDIWFLTKEEAEAKLKEREGNGG